MTQEVTLYFVERESTGYVTSFLSLEERDEYTKSVGGTFRLWKEVVQY